jgi:hypothetical protein
MYLIKNLTIGLYLYSTGSWYIVKQPPVWDPQPPRCRFRVPHLRAPNRRRPISDQICPTTTWNQPDAAPPPSANSIHASPDSSWSLGWPKTRGRRGWKSNARQPDSSSAPPSSALYGVVNRKSAVDELLRGQIRPNWAGQWPRSNPAPCSPLFSGHASSALHRRWSSVTVWPRAPQSAVPTKVIFRSSFF